MPIATLLVCWLLSGALQQPPGRASDAPDVATITALETVWNESHLRGDAEALDRLWADDLVVTVPGMAMMMKPDTIGIWRTGRMKFDRYDTSDVRVRVYGDAAVVTGRVQRTRNANGRVMDDDWRFTKTYVRRAGRWQVVAFHASPSPANPGTPQH